MKEVSKPPVEFICGKCRGHMIKKGIMESGNSKYQLFKCEKCGVEVMRALGVI